MAANNLFSPEDDDQSSSMGIEGLGGEAALTKGLKEAYEYVDKIFKLMEKTEKSSSKIGKNLQGKDANNSVAGSMADVPYGFSSLSKGEKIGIGLGMVAATGAVAMSMAPNTMSAVSQRLGAETLVPTAGGMSARQIIGQANRQVAGGATSAMGPTMAAVNLAYQGGMSANSVASRNVMKQVGGLSAITGGTNEQVATALSATNGMNFLRAGIRIRDPKGNLKPPNQMINDAYNFLFRGRTIDQEEAQLVYAPGSRSYNTLTQLAGGDPNLLGVLQAGIVARARNKKPLDAKTLASAQKSLDVMGIAKDSNQRKVFNYNSSENRKLAATEVGLNKGYGAALDTTTTLNNAFSSVAEAASGVTTALMGLKGFLQTMPSTGNMGGTVSGIASSVAGFGMQAAAMRVGMSGMGMKGPGGGGGPGFFGAIPKGNFKMAGQLGLGALAATAATYGANKLLGDRVSSDVNRYGNAAASIGTYALTGAAIGSMVPGIGTGIGATLGTAYGAYKNRNALFGGGGQGGEAEGSSSSGVQVPTGKLFSPVPQGTRISSGYGARKSVKNSQGKRISSFHRGIDFAVGENTPIVAAADGTVLSQRLDPNGYGQYITLQHANNKQTLYGHLNRYMVGVGKKVRAGDVIALSGGRDGGPYSGSSTGPHLHFEYGTGVGGRRQQVNPMPHLMPKGSLLSRLLANVKGLIKPLDKSKATELSGSLQSGINMSKKGSSNDLSSGSISSLIAGFTGRRGPISYEDLANGLSKRELQTISEQDVSPSVSSGGGRVRNKDLMNLLYQKGFRGKSLDTAFSVALAESGGRAGAIGDVSLQNSKWGPSIGLFQIRSLKKWQEYNDKYRDASRLHDPNFNAEAAFHKSNGGTSWKAWSAFTNGSFAKFLGDAAATKAALKLPSYDVGSARVPEDQIAMVHKDEMIIPAQQANMIRSRSAVGQGTMINVDMRVNIASAGIQEAEHLVNVFATKLKDKLKLEGIGTM